MYKQTANFDTLLLFYEPVLIRYLASEIPAVGFFKNLILIAAFFGTGLGLNPKLDVGGPYHGLRQHHCSPTSWSLLVWCPDAGSSLLQVQARRLFSSPVYVGHHLPLLADPGHARLLVHPDREHLCHL